MCLTDIQKSFLSIYYLISKKQLICLWEDVLKRAGLLSAGWIKMIRMTVSSRCPGPALVYTCHPEVIIYSSIFHSQKRPGLDNKVYGHPQYNSAKLGLGETSQPPLAL